MDVWIKQENDFRSARPLKRWSKPRLAEIDPDSNQARTMRERLDNSKSS